MCNVSAPFYVPNDSRFPILFETEGEMPAWALYSLVKSDPLLFNYFSQPFKKEKPEFLMQMVD